MPKYLGRATYTKEGLDGLLKEGASKRRDATAKAIEGLGGKLEAYYLAFGDTDVYSVIDLPDNVTAAALSVLANAPGTAKATMTVLITPEEMDQAVDLAKEKAAAYRPPGR